MFTSKKKHSCPLDPPISTIDLLSCQQRPHPLFSTVTDLFPAIFDLAGIPPVGNIFRSREVLPVRGSSWVPFHKKERAGIHADDHVTGWELFRLRRVRKVKWKAKFIPEPHGPGVWELFDLDADPG